VLVDHYDDALRSPKRIHSVQFRPHGKRWPLPRTITWEAVRYFVVLVLVTSAACKVVPLVEVASLVLAEQAAWLVVHLMAPAGLVYVALNAQLDGLRPHRWVYCYARSVRSPRRSTAGVPVLERARYGGRVRFYWDDLAPRLHHGWVRGGRLSTCVPVRFTWSIRHMKLVMVASRSGRNTSSYAVEDRLEVRP
jgi:hypothetical protein